MCIYSINALFYLFLMTHILSPISLSVAVRSNFKSTIPLFLSPLHTCKFCFVPNLLL